MRHSKSIHFDLLRQVWRETSVGTADGTSAPTSAPTSDGHFRGATSAATEYTEWSSAFSVLTGPRRSARVATY